MKLRDVDRALAAADPIGPAAARALELDRDEELLAAIVSQPPEAPAPLDRPRRSPPPRRRRLLRPVLAAAVVSLIAAGAVVAGLPGGSGRDSRGGLAILDRVAAAAADQAPPDTGLPYGYLKTRGTYLDTSVYGGEAWSTYQTDIVETWVARDGSARRRTTSFQRGFASAADREAWERAGRPPFLAHGWGRHTGTESFPAGSFDNRLLYGFDVAKLPTDPEQLSRWLVACAGDPQAGCGAGNGFPLAVKTLTVVAELLGNPLATPQLRAALYEAEALVPGVEDLGPASDEIGRRGIAVGARSANSGAPTVYSLIVDPRTSQVLATQEEELRAPSALPELTEPRVTSSTVYLESATTASTEAPPGTQK